MDDLLKEQVKALRENEKDILKDLGSRYFTVGEEELPLLLECCREPVEMLVELTREFIRLYGEKKREKNILDFTDMEHFALEILMERVEDEGANEQAFEMTFGNQENSHITKSEKKTSGYEDKKREVVYRIMSQAARELSMKYDEVMVDEYQDSNLVQEMITTCVSGWAKKSKNIFLSLIHI